LAKLGTFSPDMGERLASLKYFFQAILYITIFSSFKQPKPC
jgi:hypothetical protein